MGNMQINPMQEIDWSLINPLDVSPELQEFHKANHPTIQQLMMQRGY